jgi:acyl-coenzyme A thioesterase PaaI-like protein
MSDAAETRKRAAQDLAAAARELGEVIVRTEAPTEDLERAAQTLSALAGELGAHARAMGTRSSIAGPGPLNKMMNAVSGAAHPSSLAFGWELGDDVIRATTTVGVRHEGPPAMLHGGLVLAIFDDVLGTLASHRTRAMTAHFEVDFLAPVPLGSEIVVTGRITGTERRKLFIEGEMTCTGGEGLVTSRAHGIWIVPRPELYESYFGEPATRDADTVEGSAVAPR